VVVIPLGTTARQGTGTGSPSPLEPATSGAAGRPSPLEPATSGAGPSATERDACTREGALTVGVFVPFDPRRDRVPVGLGREVVRSAEGPLRCDVAPVDIN
jgi:hypothetical protein